MLVEVRRVGWDEPQLDEDGRRMFGPIRFPWRVEVAHGLLARRRRLARSFENTCSVGTAWLQVACGAVLLRANTNGRHPRRRRSSVGAVAVGPVSQRVSDQHRRALLHSRLIRAHLGRPQRRAIGDPDADPSDL